MNSDSTKFIIHIATTLSLQESQVKNTISMLNGGATIPFIARYRKEATGNLDETQIQSVKLMLEKLERIDKRRETIFQSLNEQDKLTPELEEKLLHCYSLPELEDIYLPYRPKRKTRATVAKEKGLESLAEKIFLQEPGAISDIAVKFISDNIPALEDALHGARDIIAEWINENELSRQKIRKLFETEAIIYSDVIKGKIEEGIKYKDYHRYNEPLHKCPSHRLLAIRRGETEGFLRVSITPQEEKALEMLNRLFIRNDSESAIQVKIAIKDSYKRLLHPSIETEFAASSKEKADDEAIKVFATNLRQLLLAPPLGQKRIMAIDPGFNSGCKVVCLDEQGNLLANVTIYPHKPQEETRQAVKRIVTMADSYKIDAIAIGNGTASRETEHFIRKIRFNKEIKVYIINESGASVYSASAIAREEFPQYDITVRGTVSIGRRLMDPLAELVKIDPKSIGVGQYQHDVDQNKLKSGLDSVVESCVNHVGVELNTASKHLLTYISGLGEQLAQHIIDYRKTNGPFSSRLQLHKVPRLGSKAFEQCAGFLRIRNGENPLDNTAVHPESYNIVEQMASNSGCTVHELINNPELRKKIIPEKYITVERGLPTIKDIIEELEKPGRDPRNIIKVFEFAGNIFKIEDLKPGMILPGIVTNITNFGVFVDIGVKQNGLVHISNLADEFISNPADIVQIHQHVKVKVLNVDVEQRKIQLSMKQGDIL